MAEIDNSFTAVTDAPTSTSTSFEDVANASIASGQFTVGKQYWIYVTAQVSGSVVDDFYTQVVHGSTAFAESVVTIRISNTDTYRVYGFSTVWTAISGDDIQLQFHVDTGTMTMDQIAIFAMNLDDDLTEDTDWFFDEDPANNVLGGTYEDGAALTIADGLGNDWLIVSYAQIEPTSGATDIFSRLERTGEATSNFPENQSEPSVNRTEMFLFSRVYALGDSQSNTFTSQSRGSNATHFHSTIFALNLSKFKVHSNDYTEADLSLGTTNWADPLESISITPNVTGDVLTGCYWTFNSNAAANTADFRVQIDSADDPATQTANNLQFNQNYIGAEIGISLITRSNLTAAAHTIDADGSVSATTNTPVAQDRSLWSFTMDLAAAAPSTDIPAGGLSGVA